MAGEELLRDLIVEQGKTLQRIERNLGGIDERLRHGDVKMADIAVRLSSHIQDDQDRLSSLERTRAHLKGMLTLGGTGAGIVGGIVAWFADKFWSGHP